MRDSNQPRLVKFRDAVLGILCLVTGAIYASGDIQAQRIVYKGSSYDIVIVSPTTPGLGLFWKSPAQEIFGDFGHLKNHIEKRQQRFLFATNAGIYAPGQTPLGLHVENGVAQVPLNRDKGRGNFYLQPNGVFFITKEGRAHILTADKFAVAAKDLKLATQSGPVLVHNERIHPLFKRKSPSAKIRNGVGINNEGKIVFVISDTRVNFYQFAALFRDRLKCANALYLDGSISKMYVPALKRNQLDGTFAGILAVIQ